MRISLADWSEWAEFLHRWGLESIAAWVLDVGGPLTLLGAQALYLGQPFLDRERVSALARLLEDDGQAQAFADYLRRDATS